MRARCPATFRRVAALSFVSAVNPVLLVVFGHQQPERKLAVVLHAHDSRRAVLAGDRRPKVLSHHRSVTALHRQPTLGIAEPYHGI